MDNINDDNQIGKIIKYNKEYNIIRNKPSYCMTFNPNKKYNYKYCNREIPYYVPNNKENIEFRKYYVEKMNSFFKERNLDNINKHFIKDVFSIIDENNLKIKNEKRFKDDLLHFIYIYS